MVQFSDSINFQYVLYKTVDQVGNPKPKLTRIQHNCHLQLEPVSKYFKKFRYPKIALILTYKIQRII